MRVLVTGGAGFIGSNLTRSLVRAGHEVVVMDNLVALHSLALLGDARAGVDFVHGDIRMPEDFERLPPGPFDRVYHLAASFANELSMEHPVLDQRSNVDGTMHALEFARRAGCGLFVYAASSSSYGDTEPPFCEDAPIRPHTPYAMSKYAGEMAVCASGLPFAVYRLFNVYGPGDPPGRYRNAIPNMFRSLDAPDGVLRVFGREATRDFTFVDDVVAILEDAPRSAGHVVNLGTGVETPVLDLALRIAALMGAGHERLAVEPLRSWDRVLRRCADVTRLRALHDRAPATPLEEGLARTAGWLRGAGYLSGGAP